MENKQEKNRLKNGGFLLDEFLSGGGDGDISKAICLSSTVLLTIVGAL